MVSKLVKGSAIILVGNVLFRVGGYIYRFIMAMLLGPSAYGILGLVSPFQGIFQILSAGGLPPAIAKYVSEYNALDKQDLSRQTVFTSLKIMLLLGIFFALIMVFIVAPYITYNHYHKPEALLPLQAVGLIVPFSAIVGGFRGAFQGVYKMEYILYTRAIEQISMILFATCLVIIGLSTLGAVLGSVFAFLASLIAAVYIFKKYMDNYLPKPSENFKLSLKEELILSKKLILYAIPVSITALAEMGVYTICTFIMGVFLVSSLIGYFLAADPISRLPLIISSSLATSILPAIAEAYVTDNKYLLNRWIVNSYKYGLFFVIPTCLGISVFAKEILGLIFFINLEYMRGAGALSILVIGMGFYSIYAISATIIQGIGKPKIPMYILIIGAVITFILGWFLIPIWGIEGAALTTSISSFIMAIPMFLIQFKITKTNPPYKFLLKILISSIIMVIPALLLPDNSIGLLIGIVICPIIYLLSITLLKTLTHDDVCWFKNLCEKTWIFKKYILFILNLIEKYSK